MTLPSKKLVMRGGLVGRSELVNFEYDPSKPYIYCRICGRLRQTLKDRSITTDKEAYEAELSRKEWATKHNKTHEGREHLALALSGLHLTPEAANRLAPFGIVDLVGLAIIDEHIDAGRLAPRAPTDDADSS